MNPKWDLMLRHLTPGTRGYLAAQWNVEQHHYLHRWPDPRTSVEVYAVERPWLGSTGNASNGAIDADYVVIASAPNGAPALYDRRAS